jgi:hypothetical protein
MGTDRVIDRDAVSDRENDLDFENDMLRVAEREGLDMVTERDDVRELDREGTCTAAGEGDASVLGVTASPAACTARLRSPRSIGSATARAHL